MVPNFGYRLPKFRNFAKSLMKKDRKIKRRVNGVLFCVPGGGGDYLCELSKGNFFYYVTRLNYEGHFLPILGIFLCFENFAIYTSDLGGEDVLECFP